MAMSNTPHLTFISDDNFISLTKNDIVVQIDHWNPITKIWECFICTWHAAWRMQIWLVVFKHIYSYETCHKIYHIHQQYQTTRNTMERKAQVVSLVYMIFYLCFSLIECQTLRLLRYGTVYLSTIPLKWRIVPGTSYEVHEPVWVEF